MIALRKFMRALARIIWYAFVAPLVRVLSFFRKELLLVIRQPLLVASLVLGPFLILLAFGLSFQGRQPDLRAVVVVPAEPDIQAWVRSYTTSSMPGFQFVGETENADEARQAIANGQADVAIVVPADLREQLGSGQRAKVQVTHNIIDPAQIDWLTYNAYVLFSELNRSLVATAAGQALAASRQQGTVSPEVIAAPLEPQVSSLFGYRPSYVAFYGPAVLALLLQHLAITLGAFALVRERLTGSLELFRVAPVSALEIVVGKLLAYLVMLLVLGGLLAAAMHLWLGVPSLGPIEWLVAALVLLNLASLGIGFAISVVTRSEHQAVQLAMLTLLASVFFSGFFLPLSSFHPWARAAANLLPVRHGVVALGDLMLRNQVPGEVPLYWFAGLAIVPLLWAVFRLRRQLRLD